MIKKISKLCLFILLLAGCASLGYNPSGKELTDKSLVFGKILLVRDGEESVIRPTGNSVTIYNLESTAEPLMVAKPFEKDGRFLWTLPPGQYVLAITLHSLTDDVFSLAFSVPETARAYYFGDLYFVGEKRFYTIGGANIRNVSANFKDNFQTEVAELQRRDPRLEKSKIDKLKVVNISSAKDRQAFFRQQLNSAASCCKTMAEFNYGELLPNKSVSFEISRDKGVFSFQKGKSYFKAFALPNITKACTISLISRPFSAGIIDRFRIFVPAALLLDEEFNIIERIESNLVKQVPASLFPPSPPKLSGQISLIPQRGHARYLVLYTTPQLLGEPKTSSRPGFVAIPGGAVPSGMPVLVGLDPWLTGKITIRLFEQ